MFAWLALLGRVNTFDLLQRWRPYACFSPSWCVLCKNHGEDIDHILLHCKFVRVLWIRLFGEWVFFLGGGPRLLLMAVAWLVWLERNRKVFDDRYSSPGEVWNH